MRICLMSTWPSVHTQYWLAALSKRGHEVHLLLPPYTAPADALPHGVKCHTFSWRRRVRGTGAVLLAIELRHKLRQIAPDIFHVHSVFATNNWRLFSWVAAMCTFHPLVLTAWGSDLLVPKASAAAKLFVQIALRSADLITADSRSLLEAARDLGARRDRLHEIQFGVDTELFRPDVETTALRHRLNLGSGPVVYSPRAFMPVYNQLTIVEAIPAVLKVYPDCHFVFKRRVDHHSPEYEASVQQRVEELGVTHAVRIAPELPYDELPALYALADVMISVPNFDGTPRSVLETMACGAYPVVSDVAALHEWITDQENGLFVEAIKPNKVAEAILQALSSTEMRETARLKNREIVKSRADSEVWISKMESLYRMLASDRRSHSK
jgi:L-malate glycosyltransferase